jgi:hypothetical protein
MEAKLPRGALAVLPTTHPPGCYPLRPLIKNILKRGLWGILSSKNNIIYYYIINIL